MGGLQELPAGAAKHVYAAMPIQLASCYRSSSHMSGMTNQSSYPGTEGREAVAEVEPMSTKLSTSLAV